MLFLSFIIITFYGEGVSAAHSGGTNSSGCHAGSMPYHCHGGPDNYNKGGGHNYNNGGGGYSTRRYSLENAFDNKDDIFSIDYFFLSCLVGVIGYYKRKYDIIQNKNLDKSKFGVIKFGATKFDATEFGFSCLIISYIVLIFGSI